MKFNWSHFEKNRTATNLTIVSLVAVLFVALPQYVYAPLSEATVYVFKRPFVLTRLAFEDLYQVRLRKQELQEALMQALVRINSLKQQSEENIRLRAQLGYEPPEGMRLIPLEAIAVQYRGLPVGIEVNKGSAQGLSPGLPVMNSKGLVGRIETVSARHALVQLLTDPGCRVAGRVSESREQGIIRYLPGHGLILDNVPLDGQLKQGDLVISSGLGGVFPEGLPVGVVKSVVRTDDLLFASVSLQSTVNFNAIDELYALAPLVSSAASDGVLKLDTALLMQDQQDITQESR
ncbi:rod shape-determining protein MreC [Gemmatimonas aurantiaca]|nr:rod shape-determining protein MreC [Gemmatimonas aurantiaca]